MLNEVFLKQYVHMRVGHTEAFDAMMQQIQALGVAHHKLISFSMLSGMGMGSLNAQNMRKDRIIFNAEWAVCLCGNNQEEAWKAFLYTLGHEEGHDYDYEYSRGIHREYQFKKAFPCSDERRFILWTDEVFADFYGASAIGNQRENVLEALQYKADYAMTHGKKDERSFFHPSWRQRLYYVNHYDFNETLIRFLAKETACDNKLLTDDICQCFPYISLDTCEERKDT